MVVEEVKLEEFFALASRNTSHEGCRAPLALRGHVGRRQAKDFKF